MTKVSNKHHIRRKGKGKGKIRKNPKKRKTHGLTNKDWDAFTNLIYKATRSQLDTMEVKIHKEMSLSDTAIREGFEKYR